MFQAGFGNRSFWGIFEHVFSDTRYTGLESEIPRFSGRKIGLIIPYWMADRCSDGLEQGEMEKKGCCGDLKFPTKPLENLLFYLHRVSVGDYLPGKGSRPQNSTNS